MIHFDWTISIGQVVVFLTMVGAIIRVDSMLKFFAIEHEILIDDHCERKGVKKEDLPTRKKLPDYPSFSLLSWLIGIFTITRRH